MLGAALGAARQGLGGQYVLPPAPGVGAMNAAAGGQAGWGALYQHLGGGAGAVAAAAGPPAHHILHGPPCAHVQPQQQCHGMQACVGVPAHMVDVWMSAYVHGQGLTCLGQVIGALFEVVLFESNGVRNGTALFRVNSRHPADAHGFFLEGTFTASSDPTKSAILSAMSGAVGGAVIHVCFQDAMQCAQYVQWPNRSVLHVDTARERHPAGLHEEWIPLQLKVRDVHRIDPQLPLGMQGGGGGCPGPAGPAQAAARPPAAAAGLGDAADDKKQLAPTPSELEKKVAELRERLHRTRKERSLNSVLGGLATRKKKVKKKKRKKKDTDEDDESGSSSSDMTDFSLAPSRSDGHSIQMLAGAQPGALLAHGVQQIKRFLIGRGGATDSEVENLSSVVMTYLNSVWHGAHPHHQVGKRSAQEIRTIGECLDALLRGELSELGDMLMQRLKAIQQAHTDGHWNVAGQLEICQSADVSLISEKEKRAALKGTETTLKIEESLKKAKRESHP